MYGSHMHLSPIKSELVAETGNAPDGICTFEWDYVFAESITPHWANGSVHPSTLRFS